MTRRDRFCPACFRSVGTVTPAVVRTAAAPGGAAPWVYREHQRATWRGDEQRRERCTGSGRTEHEARADW